MKIEIVTIGDEILIGQIVDTNSVFIAKEFNKIGVEVHQITSISDSKEHILSALAEAENRADLVLITGGLGPTKDDITKHTLVDYFNDKLIEDSKVLAHVEHLFNHYLKKPISDSNRKQALVPSKAKILFNEYGTASGMWIEQNDTVFVSMPGVPFEMKSIVTNHLIPLVQDKFKRPFIKHRTILTYGEGESSIAQRIEDWEANLPSHIKLAYLPSLGKVRLRLSGKSWDENQLENDINLQVTKLQNIIGDIIVGFDDGETIEKTIASLLTKNNLSLSLAESCTGGAIANKFIQMSGASQYLSLGLVPYKTSMKVKLLNVKQDLIEEFGVVSTQVAASMAKNVQLLSGSSFAIATTGNSGPTKGDQNQEVGTVCIAIATPNEIISEKFVFSNNREKTVGKAINKSLEMLLEQINLLFKS